MIEIIVERLAFDTWVDTKLRPLTLAEASVEIERLERETGTLHRWRLPNNTTVRDAVLILD